MRIFSFVFIQQILQKKIIFLFLIFDFLVFFFWGGAAIWKLGSTNGFFFWGRGNFLTLQPNAMGSAKALKEFSFGKKCHEIRHILQ